MDDSLTEQPKRGPRLYGKTINAIKMVQAGIDPKTALQAANLTDKVSDRAVQKLKAKVRKYSLNDDSTAKLANTQLKRILKGKPREVTQEKVTRDGQKVNYIEKIIPTDSNILAAASLVYDRYEPVQRSTEDLGQQVTFIDLSTVNVQIGQSGADQVRMIADRPSDGVIEAEIIPPTI